MKILLAVCMLESIVVGGYCGLSFRLCVYGKLCPDGFLVVCKSSLVC